MPEPLPILLLGGTTEAAALAERLAADPRVAVTSSLAGRTHRPASLPGALRVGGFGGAEGLAEHILRAGIALLVDATHPFASRISEHAADACVEAGIPRLQLVRPPWAPEPGDDWRPAADLATARARILESGARRVFLAIGRQELAAFAGLEGVHLLVRMIDPPETALPLGDHEVILDRGPFAEDDERALLERSAIELLVTKNSGGGATYGKVAAARHLGLPVVMVARPPLPPGPKVETVEQALDWIEAERDGAAARLDARQGRRRA